MNEKGIEQVSYPFFVGKLQSSFVWNPEERVNCQVKIYRQGERNLPHALEMHRTNLDYLTQLFTLQYAISTTASHSRNVQEFCSVDHVVVCTQNRQYLLMGFLEDKTYHPCAQHTTP